VSHALRACSAFALALCIPTAALAASDAELAEIREQIRQLKENYEARIQALEQRLKDAEAKSATATAAPPPTASTRAAVPEPAPVAATAPAPAGPASRR
jgi:hypothetical protein